MPLPPTTAIFSDENGEPIGHDPRDRVEYMLTLNGAAGLLEAGETVASYTLTLRAEGAALGLTIGTGTYAPSQPDTSSIKFWLEVADAFQNNAAYDGDGQTLGIEVEVITSSVPARRRQRTVGVKVAQL